MTSGAGEPTYLEYNTTQRGGVFYWRNKSVPDVYMSVRKFGAFVMMGATCFF